MTRKSWSREEILNHAKENEVKFIRLMYTDIVGTVKNVEVPVSQLEKALDSQISFDGSSIEGLVRIEETDMFLVPDLDSWLILQEDELGSTARLMCDVKWPDGRPYEGDPRSNLKRVLKMMEPYGFTRFCLAPELEFFLFRCDDDGIPTMNLNDQGGYFDLAPVDLSENCRRDIVIELEKLGFNIESSHHEVSPGQHEIDLYYDDVLQACDDIQTFKLVVKTVARRHNLHATFMPKPVYGISGSGLHCNLSLFRGEKNAFYDKDKPEGLSDEALSFIAGLLKYARAYTAITNPLVNSYKRLVEGFEAPVYIGWSERNRSPLIRVPAGRGRSTRVEIRSVDPSTNPYLAMAVLLNSGLQGIKDDLVPPQPLSRNIYMMTREERLAEGINDLPGSLREALKELKNEPIILDALGNEIADSFIAEKTMEYFAYQKQVTQWEIDQYFKVF